MKPFNSPRTFAVCLFLMFACLAPCASGNPGSNDLVIPAGTLMRCTLDEPNFSSKTAEVGDPIVCHLAGLFLFDREAIPRGAYLGGHLEAAKNPGHFVDKGYLKLAFDYIGLPSGQIPVPSKIIALRGYRVDRSGKIIGHGHPARDAVEWMIPPLWPEKVVTLPARGPRPTLKGEMMLTLRLMDDVAIPSNSAAQARQSGRPAAVAPPADPRPDPLPSRYIPMHPPVPPPPPPPPPVAPRPVDESPARVAGVRSTTPVRDLGGGPVPQVLALRNGLIYAATEMRVDSYSGLSYTLVDGSVHSARMEDVDWPRTFQENAQNGVILTLAGNDNYASK